MVSSQPSTQTSTPERGGSLFNRHVQRHRTAVARRVEARRMLLRTGSRSSGSLAAVAVDTKVATRHIGTRLALSKRSLHWTQHADRTGQGKDGDTNVHSRVAARLAIMLDPQSKAGKPLVCYNGKEIWPQLPRDTKVATRHTGTRTALSRWSCSLHCKRRLFDPALLIAFTPGNGQEKCGVPRVPMKLRAA